MALLTPEKPISGRSDHNPDDKNRVIVPAKFREMLGKSFVMTMGPNHSIRAYPTPIYEQLTSLVTSRSPLDELDNSFVMLQRMLGHAEVVEMDTQFRITIPRFLKDWAGIDDKHPIAIFGCGTRIELWNSDTWSNYADRVFTDEAVANANHTRFGSTGTASGTEAA